MSRVHRGDVTHGGANVKGIQENDKGLAGDEAGKRGGGGLENLAARQWRGEQRAGKGWFRDGGG